MGVQDQEGTILWVWRIHRKIRISDGLFTNTLLGEVGRDRDQAKDANRMLIDSSPQLAA